MIFKLDTTEWLHFHFSLSCTGEGNGNPRQGSCLENPRDGGAWWAAVYGVAQSRTRLSDLAAAAAAVLYGRTLFITHSVYNSLYLPIPNFQSFPPPLKSEFLIRHHNTIVVFSRHESRLIVERKSFNSGTHLPHFGSSFAVSFFESIRHWIFCGPWDWTLLIEGGKVGLMRENASANSSCLSRSMMNRRSPDWKF